MREAVAAVGYARSGSSSDERPLIQEMERRGVRFQLFDDETYVLPRWRGALRYARRAVRSAAAEAMNVDMRRSIEILRPRLFFVFKGTYLTAETLELAGRVGARRVLYFPDMSFAAQGRAFAEALRGYDLIVSSKSFAGEELRRMGVETPCEYMPLWYANASVEDDWGGHELGIASPDVLFVGHYSEKKERQLAAVAASLGAGHRLLVVGEGWADSRVSRYSLGYALYGPAVEVLYRRAKVTLGLLTERPEGGLAGDQITNRTFTVPAAGGFLLHEETEDFRVFFPGYEGVFGGEAELVTAVQRYLGDAAARERARAAMRAQLEGLGRDAGSAAERILAMAGLR